MAKSINLPETPALNLAYVNIDDQLAHALHIEDTGDHYPILISLASMQRPLRR